MCGICGFTYRDESLIGKMTDSLRHRGPDDEGVYVNDYVSLGHRRLSILDLSPAGHQPMSAAKGRFTVVHNGEIYNFMEVRRELESKGYSFKSRSDTEVILYAYEEWGRACLERFRGMFAFALWDKLKKELFIARDRLGIKPLYYMHKEGKLFFASEIKAFKETDCLTKHLDEKAIDLYFTFRFTPGSQTVLKDVQKLEPGHYMLWKSGNLQINKYWDITLEDSSAPEKSEDEYLESFLEIFRESVNLRLVSDVPVGAYLSGGLDSSFIVGIMAGMLKDKVNTFSVGLPEGKDESSYASLVATHCNTDHHALEVRSNGVDVIPQLMFHLDEPLSDAATIPTYLMSEATKKAVTVVLSGEGADELLGGYSKYKALYYPYKSRSILPFALLNGLAAMMKTGSNAHRAFSCLGNLDDPAAAYLRLNSVFLPEERMKLFKEPEMLRCVQAANDYDVVSPYLNREGDFLNRLLLLDLKTWLPDDLLLKNDKMTMAHSVEARTPFLDHHLVEFLIKVPAKYKLKWFREKHLLRKAMSGLVPPEIVKRKKQGFTVPVQKWVDNDLKGLVEELFSKENIESLGLFNHETIKLLAEKDLRNIYNRRQFWTLFSFLAWCKYCL